MDNFTKLEKLLLTKSYEQLTAKEQSWLELQGLTPADFEHQRDTLLRAKAMLQTEVPMAPPSIRASLLEHQRRSVGSGTRQRWLAAASIAAAVAIAFLLGRWSTPEQQMAENVTTLAPERVVETIRDTVYQDRTIIEQAPPQIIYRDRVVRDTVYVMPVANVEEGLGRPEVLPITDGREAAAFSRSAKETESLLKILVEVY